jgi:hypothetical protein
MFAFVALPFSATLLFWMGFVAKRQIEGRLPAEP